MKITEARHLACKIMDDHGLTSWSFAWDNAKRRSGCCHYSTKTLSFSRAITSLNSVEEFTETVLHEVAHALVGHGHGHDATWKAKCIEIGGTGKRCGTKTAVPAAPWASTHPGCEISFPRHRVPKAKSYCPNCVRRHGYTEAALITWVRA